ncbi:hypothetical protein RP20_CCG028007 [Aedes albopictus]|nr:hypothetical protein RP20_CCG028007 [Aedes albopictus]
MIVNLGVKMDIKEHIRKKDDFMHCYARETRFNQESNQVQKELMTLAIRKGFAKPALSKFNSGTRRLQLIV